MGGAVGSWASERQR
uniref:Uncharacterized protein n=1 Tax=Arundo donax TaxID=35708 RepID=A0A0A8Y299_ARUDO